jgi:hypothetical protein
MSRTLARLLIHGWLASAACGAHAQAPFGSLGNPLQPFSVVVDAFERPAGGRGVVVRYAVREGFLFPQAQMIQQHRACVAATPGATALPDAAFPQMFSVVRTEEYLSENATLTVKTSAFVEMSMDCSIRWKLDRMGTLSLRGTRSQCRIDYVKRDYAGGCEEPGGVFMASVPHRGRAGGSPPATRVMAGQVCQVLPNPITGGTDCVWIIDPADFARHPGELKQVLPLETVHEQFGGRTTATRAQLLQTVDARLFAIPAGFSRQER